jgi:hypothetical protein
MDNFKQAAAGQPTVSRDEPLGDLGGGARTWSPSDGEQGISNRPDDDPDAVPSGDAVDDARSFGEGNSPGAGDDEDVDDDGDEEDDDEDDEDEDDQEDEDEADGTK